MRTSWVLSLKKSFRPKAYFVTSIVVIFFTKLAQENRFSFQTRIYESKNHFNKPKVQIVKTNKIISKSTFSTCEYENEMILIPK